MALIKEASKTHEGQAVPTAQPSNYHPLASIRKIRNRTIICGLQAPLATWSDAKLFDDRNLEVYREVAGLLTQGQALQVLGAERRNRLGLGGRKAVANV